ncbi:MAG: hypothetical protein ACOX75_02065 [Lachnospiraceae bacterium]|jgi:hypothetical protein
MKNKASKIVSLITVLVIVLALGFTSGCGGCFGCLGCMGCMGCLGSLGDVESNFDIGGRFGNEDWSFSFGNDDDSGNSFSISPVMPEKYREYDPQNFYDLCDKLILLTAGSDTRAMIKAYDAIYEEYLHIDENGTALYVQYSENPADEYLSTQYKDYSSLMNRCWDYAMTSIKTLTESTGAEKFKNHVGQDQFEEFASYEPMTEREIELSDLEVKLIADYYEAIEAAEISGMDDASLNAVVGPIYIQLIEIRNEIARINGYDNYAVYADKEVYCRDFSEEDVLKFLQAVKQISPRVYNLMYNSSAFAAPYLVASDMGTNEMMNMLHTCADKIGPHTANAADLLIDNRLYNIGDDAARMGGAYTTTFAKSEVPYVFQTLSYFADFNTLIHEFGHFTEASINKNPNVMLYSLGALELCEIHSNGLEALFTNYYDEIFGEDANAMNTYTVVNLLSNITDGCLFDEFQRKAYRTPDISLEQINKLYTDLCAEYGCPSIGSDYWWMYVPHNYESPMYYLSYAASAVVALQIWAYAQTDFGMAVELWTSFIEAGAYEYGYMELLEKLNVRDFTDATSVIVICDQALTFAESVSTSFDFWPDDFGDRFEDYFDEKADDFGGLFGEDGILPDYEDRLEDFFDKFFNKRDE